MFQTIIGAVSSFMYSKLLVIILIGAGLYFTIRTRFPQVRLFERACESVMEKPDDKEAISSFQALMVSTASRVGTGNIVGVSSAICIGGFGSVFWMWVIAIIGSASALIESTLAQIYKKKGEDGKCYGGPAYYIEAALHCRPLAIVFCIAMILTYAFGFNMLASYNLQSTFSGFSFYDPKVSPWIIGGILAVLTGWCLLGGGSRIVKVTSTLVPVMGLAYIGMALIVVIINIRNVPEMFLRIFEEAFDFKAIFGAFAGSAMMQGIRRGLYSNEAGIGSAPNASASANVSHPVKQGLMGAFEVFADTIVVCSMTGLVVIVTGYWNSGLQGSELTLTAFESGMGSVARALIALSIFLFGLTTSTGWFTYYSVILKHWLKNNQKVFKIAEKVFILGTPLWGLLVTVLTLYGNGTPAQLWVIADFTTVFPTFVNVATLFILSGTFIKLLKDYKARYLGIGKVDEDMALFYEDKKAKEEK